MQLPVTQLQFLQTWILEEGRQRIWNVRNWRIPTILENRCTLFVRVNNHVVFEAFEKRQRWWTFQCEMVIDATAMLFTQFPEIEYVWKHCHTRGTSLEILSIRGPWSSALRWPCRRGVTIVCSWKTTSTYAPFRCTVYYTQQSSPNLAPCNNQTHCQSLTRGRRIMWTPCYTSRIS